MNENFYIEEQNRIIKWRDVIIRANIIIGICLFATEIGMYFMIKDSFISVEEAKKHILDYIVTPMSVTIVVVLGSYFFEKWHKKHSDSSYLYSLRNFLPVLINWCVLFVISYYHYIFVMTMLLFGITIILTIPFLEKKLTIAMCILSYISVSVSGAYSKRVSNNAYIHEYFVLNIVIALLLITFVGCLCVFIIKLVKNKNDSMEQATINAKNANISKISFLTNMSREVRNPISSIIGMNEMILRESREPKSIERANDIEMAASSLLALVNEMLDMATIESGKLEIHPEEYSVEQLVYAAINFVHKRTVLKKLKLNVDISSELPTRLIGDDKRMLQIITILLENAVRYTADGSITLKVDGFNRANDFVLQVAIIDTGAGLPQEAIDEIYRSFERLGLNRNDNIDGTGLGLAICNRLLAMMDSRLSIISEVGTGSNFSFKVTQSIVDDTPIGVFDFQDSSNSIKNSTDISIFAPKAKILVVDDNEVNLKVFKGLLFPSAMEIYEATSGAVAIKLCSEYHYDMIFLDHLMPGMDGIETLRHIREDGSSINRMVPVVMLTANAMSGAREEFIKEGFDDFLTKPVATNKLVEVINNLIDPNLLEIKPSDYSLYYDDAMSGLVLPNIQGVDWDKGVTNCGTKKLLIETINQFCNIMDEEISFLDEHVLNDLENYRIKVHSIKSVAATIGSDTICVLARLLEFAARDGQTDVIDRLHPVLVTEMKSYKSQVAELISGNDEKDEGDTKIIAMELNNIKSAMIEFDTDRADAAIEKINQYKYNDKIQMYVTRLSNAVMNLDADGAIEVCDILIDYLFDTDESKE